MLVFSVEIISGLDSQSKFQMFTLFSVRHIGGTPTWRFHPGFSYWALYISAKHFDECLKFGKRTGLKLGEVSNLFIFYNITVS